MVRFPNLRGYVPKETNSDFFDDGREIELLHFYARTKKYLMNVGQEKGQIVCDLIRDVKPNSMVELGGYVGYSAIMFGNAVRQASGGKACYYSIEKNPVFAAVSMALVSLAGLSDVVQVVVGSGSEGIMRLHVDSVLDQIGLLFLDHYKPVYVTDLKLCEQLKLIVPKSVIAADNVIYPGNPPYLKYVRSSVEEKRNGLELEEFGVGKNMPKEVVDQYNKRYGIMATGQYSGNPNLVYVSKLVEGKEPTGEPHQNALLLFLSFIFLPITAMITSYSLLITFTTELFPFLFRPKYYTLNTPQTKTSTPQTILVTGISMTKGLVIARLLYRYSTHRIIAADIEPIPFTSPGRYTFAISKFYRLDDASSIYYKNSLLRVIREEKVNLWISCSGVVHEVDDGMVADNQKGPGRLFRAIQLPSPVISKLHSKDTFIKYIISLGLRAPQSFLCTSAGQVENILSTYQDENEKRKKIGKPETKFILKPLGVNDKARAHFLDAASTSLLPLSSAKETRAYLSNRELALSITDDSPVLLQEFIRGTEYATHALVVRGRLKAFVACRSSDMLMHYQALDEESPESIKMREFTETVVRDLVIQHGKNINGHLSFDFLHRQLEAGSGYQDEDDEIGLYPIECNPRAHTAVVLFSECQEMASAYLSVLEDDDEEEEEATTTYHWLGYDLICQFLLPTLSLIILVARDYTAYIQDYIIRYPAIATGIEGIRRFPRPATWGRESESKDSVYTLWDPVPFFVLYHIYWPVRFLESAWRGRGWARVNVSTGKMFEC
ncbi:hypothetical protein BDV06DRAFT_230991 [Aspergillus oleicola]